LLVPGLAACVPLPGLDLLTGGQSGSEIESPAEIENQALQAGVDELLAHISDAEWEPPSTGNVRRACDAGTGDDAYLFYGSWFSSETAELPGDGEIAESGMSGLRDWLESQGWSDLELFDFTTEVVDVNAFGVEGSNLDAGISWMQAIYYFEGDVGRDYPHVVVDVDSACLVVDM